MARPQFSRSRPLSSCPEYRVGYPDSKSRNVRTSARARSGSIGFDQSPSFFIEEPTINPSASG